MPANKKYLTTSYGQRVAKITASSIGGYLLTMSFHIALAAWFDHVDVLITATYSGFIMWAVLMMVAFLGRNGWYTWIIYLMLTLLFLSLAYAGKYYNPDFLQHG